MMNIIAKLIGWFNTTATMSYDEIVFVGISRLN